MNSPQPLDRLLGQIRADLYRRQKEPGLKAAPAAPFVTISRQAGTGGRPLADALAARLNQIDPGPRAWSVWDRELVEKVAAEHKLSQPLIEAVEGPGRSWVEQFFAELDDLQVYRRVKATLRSLALAGRSVLVGRGGMFAAADLPAGVHVRLVAPRGFRVQNMAKMLNVSPARAEQEVRRIENERAAFYERHWPGRPLVPEAFTLTLNTAAMDEATQVNCILQPLAPIERPDKLAALGATTVSSH